jgi:hypothetical protein
MNDDESGENWRKLAKTGENWRRKKVIPKQSG